MKKLFFFSVLLIALPLARANQSPEDAAIHHRLEEWSAAWNQHDPKLMASFFFPDGDLINPFGKHANGRQALEELFNQEQSGTMAGTTYHSTIESIRYVGISKTIAIVDVVGEIDGLKSANGAPAHSFMHHVTWISEKKNGKWMAHAARAFAFVDPPDGVAAVHH
jgi:uncharacterized protein (TIGR02246 family)